MLKRLNVWFKCIKAQSQKDQKIIFAYIKPSVSQDYGPSTWSVALNDACVM